MKNILKSRPSISISLTTILASLIISQISFAQSIPVSVTSFQDKSGNSNCRYGWDGYWHRYIGNGFREMLMSELKKSGKIALLERELIKDIYNEEHELINSDDTSIKKKQFKKAKYTFAGSVTEFEYCANETGGSINVGAVARMFGAPVPDVSIGKKGAKAKLTVDVRIIDVTTGEVVRTVTSEGVVEDSSFSLDTDLGNYKDQSTSPMGKASRIAIQKAAADLIQAVK